MSIIALSIMFNSCSKTAKPPAATVAVIDDFQISYQDLTEQFKRMRGEQALATADDASKRVVLDEMIREQVTLFEAYRLGYHQDAEVMKIAKEKERELAAKALRWQEGEARVITEEVLQRYYQWSDRELELYYMKFYAGNTPETIARAQKRAERVYQKLQLGEDFKSLAVQFSEHDNAKNDSGKIGKVDCFSTQEAFFANAYPLAAGQFCKPFLSERSLWILQVNKIYPVMRGDFKSERPRLMEKLLSHYSSKIIEKKAEFNRNLLQEFHFALLPDEIKFFCRRAKTMKSAADTVGLFSSEELQKILCRTDIEETTISNFLPLVALHYWRSLDRNQVVEMLLTDLHINRLAKHKAMLLGINERPEVKQEYDNWLVYYLKKTVIQREVIDKMAPSEADLRAWYEARRSSLVKKKQATVREIFCITERDIQRVYRLAIGGADFAELEKKYSQNQEDRTDGIIGPFPPGPHGKLGEVAFSGMKVGEISRPFRYRGGFSIIQLLSLEPERQMSYEEAKESLKNEYIQTNWQQAAAAWADAARKNYRIKIYL